MTGAPKPETVSTKQSRIAELAKRAPSLSFNTLAHHIDLFWLSEAVRRGRGWTNGGGL
jgi:RNA-directed DNA polymerase